jgi:hypothetical protein
VVLTSSFLGLISFELGLFVVLYWFPLCALLLTLFGFLLHLVFVVRIEACLALTESDDEAEVTSIVLCSISRSLFTFFIMCVIHASFVQFTLAIFSFL